MPETSHHQEPPSADASAQSAADNALLAESAFALLRCETANDVFEVIADFLVRLIPDALVVVNEASPDLEYLTPRVIKGFDDGIIARAAKSFGHQITGTPFACASEYRAELLGGRLTRLEGGLMDLCGEGMPRQLAELAIRALGVADAYTIGITDRERTLGNCHILTRSRDAHVPAALIESLARHCFSALLGIERVRAAASSAENERETAELLHAALDQSPAGIVIANVPDGSFRYVNQSALGIRGGDWESVVEGIGVGDYAVAWQVLDLDGTPLPNDQVPLARAVLYGESASREVIIRRAEDDDRIVIANAAPIVGDEDAVIGAIVVFTDITERKHIEEALRRSELLLWASVESQKNTLLYSIDSEYRYLYFNSAHVAAMRAAYGKDIEPGMNILECITSDEDRVAAKENYDRALTGESHSNIRVFGDLERAYYESFFNPIIDADGAVIGATGLARDITQRKREEAQLAETSSYLENLFKYANAPIIVWDPDLTITRFNPAFEKLTGLLAEDVVGKHLQMLFPAEQAEESPTYVSIASEGKREGVVEIPITAADGSVHTVLWSSATIYDESGESVIATIAQGHDITQRKFAETALREAVDNLERSNQDLEHFAYIASHDLQEPLRMVSMYTELLRKRYHGQLDSDADDFISYAVEGAQRMSQLLGDLLEYSRLSTRGKEPKPVSAQIAMDEVLANLQGQIADTDATISIDILPMVMADESQLMRVFQNLISNSLKFHRDGVPPIIAIAAEPEGELWRFCITDNGIGIQAEYFDQAFETFRRLHPRASYPGTGIGLAICKRIVERLGGSIWVESSSEVGTTFCFTLPATS